MHRITKDVTILGAEHVGMSRNGNPFYLVETDQGTFRTAQNKTASQQVSKFTSMSGRVSGDLVGRVVTIEWTGRGAIEAFRDAEGNYI